MTNTNKLKGRIVEKGYTQEKFALAMGMSTVTLRRKLNNKNEFTSSEIVKACKLLDIPKSEVSDYFFCEKRP